MVRSPATRVAVAIALPALALLISELLREWLDPNFEPVFIGAIAATAWFCGSRLAAIGTLISALILDYFFLAPYNSFAVDGRGGVRFFLFLASCAIVVCLIHIAQRSRAKLAESELRYRNFAELIPFGGWTADGRGNMIAVSESFLKTFGVSMEECEGLGWMRLLDEADRSRVLADWRECMRNGYFWDYEYRLRSKTGEDYVVLSRGVPVRNVSGQDRMWVGIHLDVTDRERWAEQRVQQARNIARFHAELEQFAYVSAHDLQEPLRMIASYLQLLSKRYKGRLDEDADTFINYAVEGAERLKTLLQDLLELQQVGKGSRPRNVVPLQTVVERSKAHLSMLIEEAQASITYDELPSIECDEQAFVQLFSQLIDNAIKYRREGVPPQVHISAKMNPQRVWEICVRDNGIGISQEFRDKVFNVFQRLHPRTVYPGTGIGLAICKKVVEAHGGQIWVTEAEGDGSCFCFTIPVSQTRAA